MQALPRLSVRGGGSVSQDRAPYHITQRAPGCRAKDTEEMHQPHISALFTSTTHSTVHVHEILAVFALEKKKPKSIQTLRRGLWGIRCSSGLFAERNVNGALVQITLLTH